jgi:hypothetical protein
MRSYRHWFFVLGWNLLWVAFAFEVAGNLVYRFDHGTSFLLRSRPVGATIAPPEPFSSGEFRPVLHPYFGFLYGARSDTADRSAFHLNNHLFVQDRGYVERHPGCCDFPVVERAADEVIIGIFGGSIAGAVAITAQHDDLLARLLQASPAFAGKRIRVLDFAVGAHKQPQPLQILAYYLATGQKLDAVITIDGVNEVRVASDNVKAGVSLDFPGTTWRLLAQFVDEQAARPQAATLLRAYHDVAARDWARRAQACRWATCYLAARAVSAWHRHGGTPPAPTATPDRWVPSFFVVNPGTAHDLFEHVADHWASSVTLMHRLLAAQSTPFLVVLEPSPWFRATTPFRGGGSQPSRPDLAEIVPKGYRALLAHVPALRAGGLSVLDATGLFDQRGDEIYSDDVAHFTDEGNRMLVAEVARWLGGGH